MEENKNHLTDGDMISNYLVDMSTKARALGRSIVFSIIAASWTLSYINNAFVPTFYIKWSLALALIYLFLDLLYYVLMTAVYKYILVNYFEPISNEGYKNKENKDAIKCSKKWMNFGFVWLILLSLLLLVSSAFIILHVVQLQINA